MNQALYKLAKKSRRPQNLSDPIGRMCISIPASQIAFLSNSEKSASFRVSELVERAMKEAGVVPEAGAAAVAGMKPLPDPAHFATMKWDHEKVRYLDGIGGFTDAEVCRHGRFSPKDLRMARVDIARRDAASARAS